MEEFYLVGPHRIFVQKRPGGPRTMLFLHQSSGSSAVWDDQCSDPAFDDFTLIRIDLIGHGSSSHSKTPELDYTLAAMSQLLCSLIKQLALPDFILVALSLSTNLSGEAARMLERCKGFFLAGASIIGEGLAPSDLLQPFEFGEVLFTPAPEVDRLNGYLRGLNYREELSISHRLFSDFQQTDPRFRSVMGASIAKGEWIDEVLALEEANIPVAIIYGAAEKIVVPTYLQAAHLPLWQNKIHFIEDAGHLCNLDQPGLFNQLLLTFAEEAFAQ